MRLRIALVFAMATGAAVALGAQVPQADGIALLVARLEQVGAAGDTASIVALASPAANRGAIEDFASAIASPRPARLVIKERDRSPQEDGVTQRLLLEIFYQQSSQGFVGTWRVDVRPDAESRELGWRISAVQRLSFVSGLYRLTLNPAKQFDVRHLTVRAPDLTLEMSSGTAFVAETPEGPTAVVLIGRGVMRFAPRQAAEKTQIRIFARNDSLVADFAVAFIRLRPYEFNSRFLAESLTPRPVSPDDLRRAGSAFDEYVGLTFQIDLSDLSRERWSLPPASGDLVAEIRTKKFGTLTYARSSGDPEDVSLFDRKRRRNISVYPSDEKLASRGRFFNEDDLIDYDVLAYDLETAFAPERAWLDGNARIKIKVRVPGTTTLTMRLAETLTVRGVFSPAFGRLLHLRVVGQNSVIINLPEPVTRGDELWLNVLYSGRLEPQELQTEVIAVGGQAEQFVLPPEPRFMYSNRSYWYPQSTVTDYATAKLRITVPGEYDVVASGDPAGAPAPPPGVVDPSQRPRKVFVFEADRPVRYLACVISRFNAVDAARLNMPTAGDTPGESGAHWPRGPAAPEVRDASALALFVQANPRQSSRGRALSERTATIFKYYASLVGEAPYPSFTLAVTESETPGGHSPAYFAVLNQALPTSPFVWRNDPVAFDNYPTFFLAHEIAHQWWGQAVGWKNYHEQWISEGFAQYFAALYALEERGNGVFGGVMRQMRDTAINASRQGPVYLGYRLGHIKGDMRVFRATIYNKGAMVLHMLRHLIGDQAFFAGLRQFYSDWRFKKAGTDDFRQTMEKVSGRDLSRFFEGWIYNADIPRVRFSSHVNPDGSLLVRFEHRAEVAELPVTVKVTYVTGASDEVIVPVTERVVERLIPLKATLRSVDINEDGAALAIFEK